MKRAIIFLLVLIPFLGYGQADSSAIMPVLSDGNVGIMEVMGLDSTVSESEIYARAKLFIAEKNLLFLLFAYPKHL